MRECRLGESGVSVSVIGLGGVELGPEDGEAPDVDRAVQVLAAAAAQGINWIDTSENYYDTRNEALIGAALAKVRDDIRVATKVAPGSAGSGGGSGFRPEQVRSACEASLRRLGRDTIDIYLLHWPDDTGVPLDDTWGAMAGLAESGLVRAIGMSNYDIDAIEQCHAARAVDAVQEGLSLVDHLENRRLVARCAELAISVTVYEPMASGVLGGKSMDEVRAVWSAWSDSAFYQRLLIPGRAERSWAVVEGLRTIAARLNATVAQVAIAWVLHQAGVASAITGSRNGSHIAKNARSADIDLAAALPEIEQLIPLGPAFSA
jgi:aryl-alcohol dehydrogenase-like predicted oxidoreductase